MMDIDFRIYRKKWTLALKLQVLTAQSRLIKDQHNLDKCFLSIHKRLKLSCNNVII